MQIKLHALVLSNFRLLSLFDFGQRESEKTSVMMAIDVVASLFERVVRWIKLRIKDCDTPNAADEHFFLSLAPDENWRLEQ